MRGELEKYSEKSGATKPAFPCGFCGVRPSIGQIMIDPSDALGCPCSVVGSKAHPKPKHQCKLLGDVQYTLGAAAKCSLAAPCINRPIKCTVCSMTVWSYSMAQHFEVKHTGMPLCALAIKPTALTYYLLPYYVLACRPDVLAKQIKLDFHEKELVRQLLKGNVCKPVCKGATCACKGPSSST